MTSLVFNMITILNKPEALNYTLSLPPIIFTSTKTQVTVTLMIGLEIVVEEKYNPLNAATPIRLKYDTLIDGLQDVSLPDQINISKHPKGITAYKLTIVDSDDTKQIDFICIKGYYYPQPIDLNFYFSTNWLNVGITRQHVRTHQPVYLSAYPQEEVTVKVDCVFDDQTTGTFILGKLVSKELQSIHVSPYIIQQKSIKKLSEYTIYAVNATNLLRLRKQHYIVEFYNTYTDDFFLFQNRLGGWDSLLMTGQLDDEFKNSPLTALFDDQLKSYGNTQSRTVTKNTGYITNHQQRQLVVGFAFSMKQYHVLEGATRLINLSDAKVGITKNNLNNFDFEFNYSDLKLSYPQIEKAPNYLSI